MNIIGSFVIAFSMYSRIPMPQVEWTKERMRYALCFFPLIGVCIGAVLWAFWSFTDWAGTGRLFTTFVGTALPLLITGGIHMDGFLDTTDARSSFGDREKKLGILKDPHTGAFALIGGGVYLLLYAAAFSELAGRGRILFAGSFVLTRALSGLSVVSFPMARQDGLAASFSQAAVKRTVRISMAVYLVAAGLFLLDAGGVAGGLCILAAGLVFVWYYRMAVREFGGITGDLAGYFLQICELAVLMVCCLCGWLVR